MGLGASKSGGGDGLQQLRVIHSRGKTHSATFTFGKKGSIGFANIMFLATWKNVNVT